MPDLVTTLTAAPDPPTGTAIPRILNIAIIYQERLSFQSRAGDRVTLAYSVETRNSGHRRSLLNTGLGVIAPIQWRILDLLGFHQRRHGRRRRAYLRCLSFQGYRLLRLPNFLVTSAITVAPAVAAPEASVTVPISFR